ncbi:hypothetical protein K432DRAFT_383661 [Lepidopterella palustris CBS 459.81]|uniref:2EXR domain-containing protein n=1 Tax=Lepidopterella palustris CBS 459.81 TaxID=1314670 RepID=A0A8E2E7B3_9PEZI|nr:hypothetical protein K432DRAFT_383661 [Lepidopterella palustris CBS 459.81]
MSSFPFLQLPPELRIQILQLLLPHNTTIPVLSTLELHSSRFRCTPSNAYVPTIRISPSTLLINRQLHSEASDILYAQNRFLFHLTRPALSISRTSLCVSTLEHLTPRSLQSITKCEIRIQETLSDRTVYKRVGAKLKELVKRLGPEHCLRDLKIYLEHGEFVARSFWGCDSNWQMWGREFVASTTSDQEDRVRFQYCLEPLAALRGVAKVEIAGHVEDSFAGRLAAVMRADRNNGGELQDVPYETKIVQRKRGRVGKPEIVVKRRKFTDPTIDWDAVGRQEVV